MSDEQQNAIPTEDTAEVDIEPAAEPAEQTSATSTDAPRSGRRIELTLSLPLAIALAALLAVSVAASVTFGLLFKGKADAQSASAAALDTARSYAVTITTYDYRELDQNIADVLEGATGEFKDQYSGASKSLRQLIEEAKATAKGTVIDASVKSATDDTAEVMLFVDQSVTNVGTKQPRIDRNRVLMTLERRDDRWLASGVEIL